MSCLFGSPGDGETINEYFVVLMSIEAGSPRDNHSYVSFFGSSGRNEGIRQERQPSANRKFLLFKQGFPEWQEEMSHVMRKLTFWFPTLSSTKQVVQLQ